MSRIFITVLNMSVTAGFTASAVIIIRVLLKKAPKVFSYALWSVVLFRLLCPYSLESAISLIPSGTEIIPAGIIYSPVSGMSTGIELLDNTVNNTIQTSLPPDLQATGVNPMEILLETGSVIWMFGIIILLSYGVITYFKIKHRLSEATLVYDNVYESDRIQTAFVLGLIKPRIIIPANLSNNEMSCIIKHEETHIRRCDYLIKPIAFFALIIHWFNPVIWLSYFLMAKDMEMSCDESVMKHTGEDIRAHYSQTLLTLSVKQTGLLSPLAFGESNVKSRIKNVLNYKRPALWAVAAAVIVLVSAFISLGTNSAASLEYESYESKGGMFIKSVPPTKDEIAGMTSTGFLPKIYDYSVDDDIKTMLIEVTDYTDKNNPAIIDSSSFALSEESLSGKIYVKYSPDIKELSIEIKSGEINDEITCPLKIYDIGDECALSFTTESEIVEGKAIPLVALAYSDTFSEIDEFLKEPKLFGDYSSAYHITLTFQGGSGELQ